MVLLYIYIAQAKRASCGPGYSSCEASDSEKGCTSSKDPKSSSSSSSRKHQGKEAAAKAQNEGERKCEAVVANVIIISTETSNGRALKERSRKKKTGGGSTFTSLLTARSKVGYNTTHYIIFSVMHCMPCCSLAWKIILIQKIWPQEAATIGGVARKREDLIIVNIDKASGDDELTSCC
ncbi:hypothetical protein Dimus_035959 [Dionaea muscipula]